VQPTSERLVTDADTSPAGPRDLRLDRRLAALLVLTAPLGLAACGLFGGSNSGAAPVVIQSVTESPSDAGGSPTSPAGPSSGSTSPSTASSGPVATAAGGADVVPVTTTITKDGQVVVRTRFATQVQVSTKTAVQISTRVQTQVQTQQVTKSAIVTVTLPAATVTETQVVTQPAKTVTNTVTRTVTAT